MTSAPAAGGNENTTTAWTGSGFCRDRGQAHKLAQKGKQLANGRWVHDTDAMDLLLEVYGYRDLGRLADDPTPTTNPESGSGLRIDRILCSRPLPLRLLDYSLTHPPAALSDHAYVRVRTALAATTPPDHDEHGRRRLSAERLLMRDVRVAPRDLFI
ncbi:endonuclease/exonuclease/phosphatase family protein [Actinokineospora iranica]|uniref:Endonuclease/Exonuclease/phosphatase family protein n=1 Tax=Actinokineospora iranica TaxID=1271860 RepID=A0A1G6WSI9_9PSEU|nr:endonuclease/exonuclease/phosphatase family protein [Actinokineospora iranica]SDD68890.1 hypothetical protein SAMN05216174_115154 [Actinokineospora iranica]